MSGTPARERAAWTALLLASLALHLVRLDERPFHHDEAVHGWFSQNLAFHGEYRYDPIYHGPVQYYAVAAAFRLLGDSDFSARLPAALGGVALVALAWLLRPRLGPRAAFASGLLLAISPTVLYYTRFCREDVWSLLGTGGAFLLLDAWWRARRLAPLCGAALCAAVAFAAKENFYVLLALMVPAVGAALLDPERGLDVRGRLRQTVAFLGENAVALSGALLLFFNAAELLYTVLLANPDSGNPAWEAISYWWGQHTVERIGGPRWYYLPRIAQYELAIAAPALVYAAVRWRRLSTAGRFLAGWGLSSLAMYAWLGEKTPWLIVHQLLPLVPLAGLAWARLSRRGLPGLAVSAAAAALTLVSAVALSFWNPALTPRSPRAESVVYVQTAPELVEVVRQIEAAARGGARPAAAVDGEAGWPLNWYLRHLDVSWAKPAPGTRPPVVVVDPGAADAVAAALGPGYSRRDVPLRVWWLPEVSLEPLRPTPGQLVRYLFTRVPWSPIGWQSVTVFEKLGQTGAVR